MLDGLEADVVTFNQFTDVQILHDQGDLVAADWQSRLPNNSVALLLDARLPRAQGQPEEHQGLGRPGARRREGRVPQPEDLGQRPLYLSRGLCLRARSLQGRRGEAQAFVRKLFANVPVFDTGGRAATTTFVERGIGDVLVTFEAEVNPSASNTVRTRSIWSCRAVSLRADFPVAVVDKVVDERGSRKIAEAYLNYLYTPEAQEIIATHSTGRSTRTWRRSMPRISPAVRLLTVEDVFGGWKKLNEEHLANGTILDQLYVNK